MILCSARAISSVPHSRRGPINQMNHYSQRTETMNAHRISRCFTLTTLVIVGTIIGSNQHVAAQQPQPPQAPAAGQAGVEVLTRGPVHEAFAETITFNPEPGIVAPKAPPAAIEEVPPQQRPEGKNLTWIPGYWGWDDERNDFLWISGIWRALPPGRQWVPGYWGQSRQGAQWTSGYWADANATEIQYLPEPPATVEEGPNIAAPSPDQNWLPGCWVWQQNRYAWRAGYWAAGNQDWDWVPDHYVWTPSGYVYVDGYYDYSVPRRGIVFAPVYFDGGLRTGRGFSYSPSTVINPGVFVSHLFLRPSYGHYYFGDYYDSNYADAGFSPWFSYQSSRRGYDPIYANQRWQHRQDRDWEHRTESNFRQFRDHKDSRPPHTWTAQQELAKRGDKSSQGKQRRSHVARRIGQAKRSRFRFQPVDQDERQQFGQRGQAYRKYLEQRQQLEANAARKPGGDPATATGPPRKSFSRSPFVAMPADQLGKNDAPPQRHVVLKPDLQVQPQPVTRGRQSGTRKVNTQGAATEGSQQDPKARRRFGVPGSSAKARVRILSKAQGDSNNQSQDAPQNQPKGESKKKDKD